MPVGRAAGLGAVCPNWVSQPCAANPYRAVAIVLPGTDWRHFLELYPRQVQSANTVG